MTLKRIERLKEEGLPVLIPAKKGEQDGYSNFQREVKATPTGGRMTTIGARPLRVILRQDLGKARDHLDERELTLFVGASYVKDGFNTNDRELRRRGFELLSRIISEFEGLVDYYADIPGQASLSLPWIITETIKDVQVVLWYFRAAGRFSPAIYCPDMKTAMFVHMFLGNCGACPECGKPFIAKKIGQLYCRLEHQNSYRNRRWRARKETR